MKSGALISIAMTLCGSLVSFPLTAQEGNNLSSAPREYTLQVLPGPPGLGGLGNANSINDRGWVTGVSNPSDDSYDHAVLWRDGEATDLGTLAGQSGYNSSGPGNYRNDTGWVVGSSETLDIDPNIENFCGFICLSGPCAPHICKGYLWQSKTNQMIALPPLPGGSNSAGAGANNQEIFGFAENGVPGSECSSPQVLRFEGVVWSLGSDGTPFVSRRLSPVAGDTVSEGLGINEVGDIVGLSGLCAPPAAGYVIGSHAALWKKHGSVIDLGNLGGATFNAAVAINNHGQVVGCSDLSGELGPHAFLWEEGIGMVDLGVLPGDDAACGQGINDRGEVVGLSCSLITGNCRGFHWQAGVMTDINSLLPAGSHLEMAVANDINSRGEIPIAAIDPTIDPTVNPSQQVAAVLIPVSLGKTPLALMIPDPVPAAARLGFNAVSTDSLPSRIRMSLQQRMKLGPFGRPPSVVSAHSTRPNADALMSTAAGAKPSTSKAASQSCGVVGAICGSAGRQCCAGELCGRRRTCCNAPFKGSYCNSYYDCCDGLGCFNHSCG